MARAKELLDLVGSPTAVVTAVLLTFSRAQLERNKTGVDKPMTIWALVAAGTATLVAAGIVAVMTPLAIGITLCNNGDVETRLLVYALTYLVAIGTTTYAVYIAIKCKQDRWHT